METELINSVHRHNDVIEAMRTEHATGAELNAVIRQQREDFIALAQQTGRTREEAEALADTYGLIPREVTTTLVAETDAARNKIQTFLNHYNGSRISVTVDAVSGAQIGFSTGRGNRLGLAEGALLEFYGGGGLRPMSGNLARMVPANTWRVIGDRPHGDEAFIPIDNSARSLALWEETGRRLGVLAPAPSTTTNYSTSNVDNSQFNYVVHGGVPSPEDSVRRALAMARRGWGQ